MYAWGGSSLAPPPDFIQASLATDYVQLSGAGGFKALELERLLTGKLASARPFISLSTHGVSGSAAPGELETALQLLHLAWTTPGSDSEALALMKRRSAAAIANRGQSPGQVFSERLALVNTSNHYTAQPPTSEQIASIDAGPMLRFYRERFANAADFTLFMVGAFKTDAVLPLLARYVGALPSTGTRTSQFRNVDIRFPAAIVREQVNKGKEPRAQTAISFFAEPGPDAAEQEGVQAMTTILSTTLRDTLREELGQTYTVQVGLAQSYPQRGDGHVRVVFGAAPDNISGMTERVLQEIRRLQEQGPSDDLTSRAKETARRGYETAMRDNGYWMGRLQRIHMIGADPHEIVTRLERIDAMTPATVQDAFRRYFPMDRYTVVTLVPEN